MQQHLPSVQKSSVRLSIPSAGEVLRSNLHLCLEFRDKVTVLDTTMEKVELWIIVTTLAWISAPSSADVDQNQLVKVINEIRNMGINGMYSVAVSIPKDDGYDLKNVPKPKDEDKKEIENGKKFEKDRIVIAKLNSPEHAEFRVVDNLHLESNEGDMLVIFSYASPCDENCAKSGGKYNIIDKIKNAIKGGKWENHVFVFEKIFKPDGNHITKDKLETALKQLGTFKTDGLKNIFRCYSPTSDAKLQCISCSTNEAVTSACVDYNL
ncbi:hypothetical protein Q5P01_025712 [Channa striata]|uniref:Uncharacterized protein n=1 Tax=Channa striata TaxID=64152 RepID=A0AA88INP8_CHASR|nr:hypothetical protein Q5P01_025712 [Channa striata]